MGEQNQPSLAHAIGLLGDLVSISPATAPTLHSPGGCHYCGEPVRNALSGIIRHTDGCYWWQAKKFIDSLPSEWVMLNEEEATPNG